jgi:hypothetical protein
MLWPSLMLLLLLLRIHRLPIAATAALEKRLLTLQTLLLRAIATTSRPAAGRHRIVVSHWRKKRKFGMAVRACAGCSRLGGRRQQLDGNATLAWERG